MLTIHGEKAFSDFRRKLLEARTGLIALDATFVYYINPVSEGAADVLKNTNSPQRKSLEYLLSSNEMRIEGQLEAGALEKQRLFVFPRPGTVSPWSSKATDIAYVCGLDQYVARIERATIFTYGAETPVSTRKEALYDRMMETISISPPRREELFQVLPPSPLNSIQLADSVQTSLKLLKQANSTLGLALAEDEMSYLVSAFRGPAGFGRDPTDVELFMFAQVNSEHCRHKIFNAEWTINGEKKPFSLFHMIRNTHLKAGKFTISAYSDNAAVFEGPVCPVFAPESMRGKWAESTTRTSLHYLGKVETHNHPTAVSPFPGAATGSGGEIRDEGAVGLGSKPKAGLAGYSVSDLLIPDLPQPWEKDIDRPYHIASSLDIMLEAPIGSAAFNNEFGRPCIVGYFRTFLSELHGVMRGYHKPIMLAGGVGSVQSSHALKRGIAAGSVLVVLGGPAMLIGLGGGAASSMMSSEASAELDFASVQRGNPEMQRRAQMVIDACTSLGSENPIQSIHDVGAGGLSNALPELVHDAGLGATFELRNVPCIEPGMSPMEIWCCEAQERYVLAIAPEQISIFEEVCVRERCLYGKVGVATSEPQLVLTDKLFGSKPIDLPMATLFGKPPRMSRQVTSSIMRNRAVDTSLQSYFVDDKLSTAIDHVLQIPCVGSKSFLITIGDRTVGGLVARDQMVGPWQTPVADVGVTATRLSTTDVTGEAMAIGEKPLLALISAKSSSRMAVGEALLNIVAANIVSLEHVKLSANWMCAANYPGEGALLYDAVQAVGLELCPELGISIPVGKDSMSMTSAWQDRKTKEQKAVVAPVSLVITAFCSVSDITRTWTPMLHRREKVGDTLLVYVDLAIQKRRMGASAFAQTADVIGDDCPDIEDVKLLKDFVKATLLLHQDYQDMVLAYHDRSDGGLMTTLLEMAFAGRVGLDIDISEIATNDSNSSVVETLFSEELGVVFQIRRSDLQSFLRILSEQGLPSSAIHSIGCVRATHDQRIALHFDKKCLFQKSRKALQQTWQLTSMHLQKLRDNPKCAQQEFLNILDDADPGLHFDLTFDPVECLGHFISRPKVAILREQGVNGHVEMAFNFTQAGFDAFDVHMTDILTGKTTLEGFTGIAACGGFSYGDVLGAGSGWAKSVLMHERSKSQFSAFFSDRKDTFAIGVCNGCQFFSQIKELIPGADRWPHFERNESEQYEARVCKIQVSRVAAQRSVFLNGMGGSLLPVAAAHGEGRATLPQGISVDSLAARGLLPLQYVDNYGSVTETYPFNPNGSPQGLAGVQTPDGRVLILMPHPERVAMTWANSWYSHEQARKWQGQGPWTRIFNSARRWVG